MPLSGVNLGGIKLGILEKRKRDMIVKMRKEGYIQREIAEKLGVNLKTVRKYDHSTSCGSGKRRTQEERLTACEAAIRTALDWLHLLWFMAPTDQLYDCPKCGSYRMKYDDYVESTFVCERCGYQYTLPFHLCHECFSRDINYDDYPGYAVCERCGNRRSD